MIFPDYDETTKFEVTENHLKLLKEMYVDWDGDEYGAPCIDPKRPFRSDDPEKDMLDILGVDYGDDFYDFIEEHPNYRRRLDIIYHELQTCLQILINDLSIKVGWYKKKDKYNAKSWEYIGNGED